MLACMLPAVLSLDAKWTPNGEAPAPFSTKARQQMGMDPAAFAGQAAAGAPLVPPGTMMKFNLLALLIMYITNNWKMVIAVQDIVLKALQPFLNAAEQKKAAKAREVQAKAKAAARSARLDRLAQASSAAADDDDEDN